MVKVICLRYPTKDGVVEVSPNNPVPVSQQKMTAAHDIYCGHSDSGFDLDLVDQPQWFAVVNRQPLEGEVVVGGPYPHAEETSACPVCGRGFDWAMWDADEFSASYNRGAEEFVVVVTEQEAEELGLFVHKSEARMKTAYF